MPDNIHDAFGSKGAPQSSTAPDYTHPNAEEIIQRAIADLNTIPEGKRLIGLIKDFDLSIRVLVGREPGFFVPNGNTIVLTSPKALAGVNHFETACNLGLAIKEIEINLVNIQRLDGEPAALNKKAIDIVLEMCKLVSDFFDVHNHTKLVDLMDKLGHGNTYRLFRSKAGYQELADQITKNLSSYK